MREVSETDSCFSSHWVFSWALGPSIDFLLTQSLFLWASSLCLRQPDAIRTGTSQVKSCWIVTVDSTCLLPSHTPWVDCISESALLPHLLHGAQGTAKHPFETAAVLIRVWPVLCGGVWQPFVFLKYPQKNASKSFLLENSHTKILNWLIFLVWAMNGELDKNTNNSVFSVVLEREFDSGSGKRSSFWVSQG